MSFFSGGPDYSLLIPVYNSEKTLSDLCQHIQAVFSTLPGRYEVVRVDDGSRVRETWGV